MSLLKEVSFFEQSTKSLLDGNKLFMDSRNEEFPLQKRLYDQLSSLYKSFYLDAEPQSYVIPEIYQNYPIEMFGNTSFSPISSHSYDQANNFRILCSQLDTPISDYEYLGLRDHFSDNKVNILAAGGLKAFAQAMEIIRRKLNGESSLPPLIVQGADGLWKNVFKEFDTKELNCAGVYFSSGDMDTAKLLVMIEGVKISPDQVLSPPLSHIKIDNPIDWFATTDTKKLGEIRHTQKNSDYMGHISRAFDVLGTSPIPVEDQASFQGNAYKKLEALTRVILFLGLDEVRKRASNHGQNDLRSVRLMTNDGGLGFCLENSSGERYIDLFPQEFFPDSHHVMNPTQMAPGVELAYLMRTIGLEDAFGRLRQSVNSIVKKTNREFKHSDLRAYDTSLQMILPLSCVLDAFEKLGIRGGAYKDLHEDEQLDRDVSAVMSYVRHDIHSIFSMEKLKVSYLPKGSISAKVDTTNFLIDTDTGNVRADNPEWVLKGPNARGYLLLQRFLGASLKSDIPANDRKNIVHHKLLKAISLGWPEQTYGRGLSQESMALRKSLTEEWGIKARLGLDAWKLYKDNPSLVIEQASEGASNSAFLAGVRELLKNSDILYVGDPNIADRGLEEKLLQGIGFMSHIVDLQTFATNRPMVVDRSQTPDLFKLLEHKQRLGLVGQDTGDLMHVVDGRHEAAKVIAELARESRSYITHVEAPFVADGEHEKKDCTTVTVYCSATNVNKTWVGQMQRLGYLLAVNGFSLKVGGGNDGLMKAVADGFQRGKGELAEKGYGFPNQLILIQCHATEAIEERYKYTGGDVVYRCHPTIEPREADLQTTDIEVAGSGGVGTDQEIFGSFYSRTKGFVSSGDKPFFLFNQQMVTLNGSIGVHDLYKDVFSPQELEKLNASFILTPEEIISQCVLQRYKKMEDSHVISLPSLRSSLREEMGRVAVVSEKRFVPPYRSYVGQEGELVTNNPNGKVIEISSHPHYKAA